MNFYRLLLLARRIIYAPRDFFNPSANIFMLLCPTIKWSLLTSCCWFLALRPHLKYLTNYVSFILLNKIGLVRKLLLENVFDKKVVITWIRSFLFLRWLILSSKKISDAVYCSIIFNFYVIFFYIYMNYIHKSYPKMKKRKSVGCTNKLNF